MSVQSKYVAKKPDENDFIHYTEEEHGTWEILYNRQVELVKDRAVDEFLLGLEILKFSPKTIPQHTEVNNILKPITGWTVKPVEAIIPAEEFFDLLANKVFPMASFIRTREELDYLEEPDIFHELFGHCPLLTNQAYADFMEKFGKLGLRTPKKDRLILFRLFWFTIEFGLMKSRGQTKIYGGGILSSIGETTYSLESDVPVRQELEPMTCLRTPYRIDIMQPIYFIAENWEHMYKVLEGDTLSLIEKSKEMGSFKPLFEPAP
jgi:phenylalanine-4-hydroxylase